MNILDRAIGVFSPQIALERTVARERLKMFGYDAARREGARGSSGGMQKNARSENPRMAKDRMDLMWDARDLERNMPILRCVLDRFAMYVCGTIKYQAQSGDPEYDRILETYFEEWCSSVADITGRHDFRLLTELGYRSSKRDGDFGFQLVRQGDELRLRSIEADRIGDPSRVSSMIEPDLFQGIRVDPETGAPLSYQIFKCDPKSNKYTFEAEIPADQMYLIRTPLRTDEYRSVTWFAPVLKQCRDLYELFSFELGAAKWGSSIAGIVRSVNPLAKVLGGPDGQSAWDGTPFATTGAPQIQVMPNTLIRLNPNEDITAFNPGNRASGAFASAVENYLRDIAMGLNVPYGFFDMSRFGGATVRLEAMMMQRTFNREQNALARGFLTPVKDDVIENAIAFKKIPPPPAGVNAFAGRWQFGAHLTADTGYDTDANLQLLQNGLKTAAEIAGEEGEDFEDMVDQLVKEAVIIRDRCAAAGVPVELVAGARFPAATQQLAAAAEAMQPPPPAPQISDVGDGAAKAIVEICEKVSAGTLPRESAMNVMIAVYGFDPAMAESTVPEFQSAKPVEGTPGNPKQQPMLPGGPKKPGADKKSEPAKGDKEAKSDGA